MLAQALRMTRRDWRAGELRFLLIALIVAVSALTSVGFFVDRMRGALARDAHQLLGADLVVRADQPIDPSWLAEAEARKLRTARTTVFPSMASSGAGDSGVTQLASVKAVTPGYPLRGKVKLKQGQADQPTREIPAPGTVWVDDNLLLAHKLKTGDQLRLGTRSFRIAQVISVEPDRGAAFMNFAPRVMLAESDLPSTGLIQYV
jgi:putative ABC transport system permease protein